MPELVNCTPHPIRILLPSDRIVELPASDTQARLKEPRLCYTMLAVEGEPVKVILATAAAVVEGLPPQQAGTYYLVSSLVAAACRDRPDVLAPATGPCDGARRNVDGQVVAVTRLKRYYPAASGGGPSSVFMRLADWIRRVILHRWAFEKRWLTGRSLYSNRLRPGIQYERRRRFLMKRH